MSPREFDRTEIRSARTMQEADHYWKSRNDIAVRQDIRPSLFDKVRALLGRLFFVERGL